VTSHVRAMSQCETPCGRRGGHTVTTLPVTGLFQPTGVAVGSRGVVYVSNYGASTATAAHPGEILKITGLS
jgi:hypothetical protein